MSIITAVPWGLLLPAGALVALAFAGGVDVAPDPATTSHYTWTPLHRHGGEVRGPRGLGVMFSGVADQGGTLIATDWNQSFRSTDSGTTWSPIPDVRGASDVAFGDSGLVVIARFAEEFRRSTDDGATWSAVDVDVNQASAVTIVEPRVYASSRGAVVRSLDRGLTWTRHPTAPVSLNDLAVAGETLLAVGGAGLLARSTDGGTTWTSRWLPQTNPLRSVAFADENTAVIVGQNGMILRSTDAGVTWDRVDSPARTHLRAVAFATATDGLAVGFWGEAIRTSDAGATWQREASGTRLHLLRITPRAGGGYLVSGLRETILAVGQGGEQ